MNRRCRILLATILASTTGASVSPARAQDEVAADAERLTKALDLKPGHVVADIGAGAGQLTVALARIVGSSGRVYATELDASLLRLIRRAVDSAAVTNVSIIEAHATRTNLPDGCCDALVVRYVYHHLSAPREMNASMRQALKPGGLLAVIDYSPDGVESADPAGRAAGDSHGVTPATVARELREAGFEVVRVDDAVARRDVLRTLGFMVVARRPQVSRGRS